MRLIDADAFKGYIDRYMSFFSNYDPREIKTHVNAQPTIEAEPVRHGRWIWDDEGYHCSECFFHAYGETLECLDGTYKYCPTCGAKMDEVNDE